MTRVPVIESPVPIIVGSGIAGLSCALNLNGAVVVTASQVAGGSSALAQGGVAAAMGHGDSTEAHADDTRRVGAGIVDPRIADLVTGAAPDAIERLLGIGADFDVDDHGDTVLGREAGHSTSRIVHAGGDATGAEIMRALRSAVLERPDITLLPRTRLIDLIRSGDRIVGLLTTDDTGDLTAHTAPAVVLATGGIGGIYARSTNPTDVTGAGIAAAARQGAELADMEFVQFHPTAFTYRDHPAPLVTEALRGAGAVLIDERGDRFMIPVHPDAELAPRDIVARAIWRHIHDGHDVFLDATSAVGDEFAARFPTVHQLASEAGIDPARSPIPVAPAEHFHMGGVSTDAEGRSSIDGLYAVGEVASTGLHGANRLASNSLLEGMVMGRRAAAHITSAASSGGFSDLLVPEDARRRIEGAPHEIAAEVQRIAWEDIGIERSGERLISALEALTSLSDERHDAPLVASLIAESALLREESRGAHFRIDHPTRDPDQARRSRIEPKSSPLVAVSDLV